MIRILPSALVASAFLLLAQTPASALTPQQELMKSCNADAKGQKLGGGDRKTFMSSCLKGEGGGPKPLTAQQEKMKSCNTDATSKTLKGKERRAFMSTCLKG